ncbi:SDR family oxidoreductase [Nocardioides sp. CER19]|uniref:SDR family oxidoreductase n=1 Tax=Nocardioides sp. CER19 TaxID=3038538 RepID=UPI002449BFEA|nr:SDR family oxidoreductase [Nocardioides sp. CER19]MDH2415254.1 SDR family oxidoreductase [Nocardioides sp. CER19]
MNTQQSTQGRVAIVTGGSGGIGQAVCHRLADEGYALVVSYAGRASEAEVLVKEIGDQGGRAVAVGADVADPAQVGVLFDAAEHSFGGIDVVVNTAGIMLLSPLAEQDLDVFDRMVRINLRGTYVVSQESARRVRAGGAIINFSSSIPKLATPNYSGYAATKGGVEALTLILARELRGRDITVNAVAPGPTATPLFLDGKPQEVIDHLAKIAPLERLGTPQDSAEVVAFLAGPARWVNGQVIYANGGAI